MEENLKDFLDKFAELERRTRKLAAEDRSLRQEVAALRERLVEVEAHAESLRESLSNERGLREKARDNLSELIDRLDGLKGGGNFEGSKLIAEVADGERGA